MKKRLLITGLVLILLASGVYWAVLHQGEKTPEGALSKQKNVLSDIIYSEKVNGGVVLFTVRNIGSNLYEASYIKNGLLGWKWKWGGGYSGAYTGMCFSGVPGTPFPMIYGNINNEQIAKVKITDKEHGITREAKIVSKNKERIWFTFLKETDGPIFVISYLSNTGQIIQSNSIDVRTETNLPVINQNVGSSGETAKMPQQMPPNFQFVLNYGVKAKNVLDTSKETFTKDLIIAGTITTKLRLTPEERQTIYEQMRDIAILSYPEVIKPLEGFAVSTPMSYSLTIGFGNIKKSIYWDDVSDLKDQRSVELRNLINNIRIIIESKKEYKKLPPARGGYA